MKKNAFTVLFWCAVAATLALWLINWWAGRSLFIDEANVARNLYDRSFTGLFQPLDHQQYAGPLYLVLGKAAGELLGYREWALRLPAFLGGLAALYALCLGNRSLRLGPWGILTVLLLMVNAAGLRYVGEVKPYAMDLGMSAIILVLALRENWSWRTWLPVGLIAPWLSLPAIFVLASVGVSGLFKLPARRRLGWSLTGAAWLLSFAVLRALVLSPALGSAYLAEYHQRFFLPLPGADFSWSVLGSVLETIPKTAFGFTAFSLVIGTGLAFYGAIRTAPWRACLLLSPTLFVLVASAGGYYSILPRLILFTLPGWWWLAVIGTRELPGRYWRGGALAAWLVVLVSANTLRHFVSPLDFSGVRGLVTQYDRAYRPVLHRAAVPGADYYWRIHPDYRLPNPPPFRTELSYVGREVFLYGHSGGDPQGLTADIVTKGRGRGCKARIEESKGLRTAIYLDCPD